MPSSRNPSPPAPSDDFAGRAPALARRRRSLDWLRLISGSSAAGSVVLIAAITIVVALRAWPAFREFGPAFLWSRAWNPVTDQYGALPLIVGTLVTSLLALLVAAPLGVCVAIVFTQNILPFRLREILAYVIELLAAIPSVVYGLWGIAVVIPITSEVGRWLFTHFHRFPLFSTPPVGPGILPASLVLAVMILPTVAALSRSSLRNVPAPFIEGAYALGATRWEVLFQIALPSARTGILGAVVLALGRAMGETMALAMLVGNSNRMSVSILAPGNTIASLLANSFGEAGGTQLSALMYLSFVLLALTLVINLVAQRMLGGERLRA